MNSFDLIQMSEQFDVSPDYIMSRINLLKADDPQKLAPGIAGRKNIPPLMGFTDAYNYGYNTRGVKDRIFTDIPDIVLRQIERKNPVIGACVNLRCRQIREFSKPVEKDYAPGWKIIMKEATKKPDKKTQKEIELITDFLVNTGMTNFEGWEEREDTIHDVMVMMAREWLTIDKIAMELRRDAKGNIVDFWLMDGSTIRKVAPGGYRSNKTDFDSRIWVFPSDEFFDKLAGLKLEYLPPVEEIAYVQEVNGQYVAAFRKQDIIFDIMQKRVDIQYRDVGYSPTEQSITAVTAFLNALSYNAEHFKRGAIPKFALAFEDGRFTPEQFQQLQDEWIANFQGIQGMWKIPMLNGKINMIDLMRNPRDMEYGKYLELTGALICSVFGVDPAEIGLRFQQGQNVLNENVDGKMQFSKDRGLRDCLGEVQSVFNKLMRFCGWSDKYKFFICGLDPQDPIEMSKLRTESVRRDRTINELRAEEDKKPIDYGDVILDPSWLNYVQQQKMMEQQQQEGGEEEEGFGGEYGGEEEGGEEGAGEEGGGTNEDAMNQAIDEAAGEMANVNKAQVIKARTLLL